MDWQSDIAIIQNDTHNSILVAKQPSVQMTDSILYNERFSTTWINANASHVISLPNIKLSLQPDSAKAYLFVFNCDSVDKYQSLKKTKGIMKSAFIRKIEIQLNKVKEPLDTINIK
jgi:hypothetical protein